MFAIIRANLLASALGLAVAILLPLAIYQSVQIHGFLWFDGLKDEIEDCAKDRNELRAMSTKKNEQKAETSKRIEQADKGRKDAETIAQRIERAPTPEGCVTAPEVMGADL